MVVTEMDTSNRVSGKGLGMKRKGSETLGFIPPQKPNFSFLASSSLRSRRLEVVGTRKNGRARRRHARGEEAPARKAPENRFPPPL